MTRILSPTKGFLSHFPVPEYLLMSTAGLSANDESIKFIQFHRSFMGNKLKVSQFEKIVLAEGVIQSGYINDAATFTKVLRQLAQSKKVSHVYATLPEERAYLFTALIEKVPTDGLRDAVAFIIEENVPVSLKDSVFDFTVVDELRESNQLKVVVSVLSHKVVDFYVQVFEEAGLTPVSFDIESQAIARAIIDRGDKRGQLIVNLGRKRTGLYVVEDEVVQFTTTLQYGVSDDMSRSELLDLKNEIKKVVDFWTMHSSSVQTSPRKIERMLLCGPGVFDQGLINKLVNDLPLEYSFADPWSKSQIDSHEIPLELRRDSLDYLSAIGLALPH